MSISTGSYNSRSTVLPTEVDVITQTPNQGSSSENAGVDIAAGRMRADLLLSETHVRVVYDPASVKRAAILEQLNQVVRLGYRPVKSSTK